MTNTAYLLGYDGITFNTQTRIFQTTARGGSNIKKSRIHVNKILSTIQNRAARICKNPPKYDCRPETNDTEDKDAARLSLQVLGALWLKLGLNHKRIPLMMWVQQCGHSYIKISWDGTLGQLMQDPMSGEHDFEGDVRADIVSAFEVYPDPMAKSFDDALESYVTHCKVRKLDYFKKHWPDKGHLVKAEDAWLLSAQYEQRIGSINARGPQSSSGQEAMKNSAIEMVRYEARSKDYPNGRQITIANGIVLDNKELPCGIIPFAKFDDIVIGGKYYSESVITHLRPIQDSYNEDARRQHAWMRKFLAGKFIAPRAGGLAQEALNDSEDGEVVMYDPVPSAPGGGAPTALQVPALPQWAFQLNEVRTQEMNDISGISEVSRGTLPSASIPAIGMQLLTEQDDTRIGVMTEQHEHAWSRVGQLVLKYFEFGYKLPRKMKLAGQSLQYTVKELSGESIRGNTDVYVVPGTTRPGSKTLDNQEILNRFDRGLLGNPQDPKVIEKVNALTEFGDISGIWQDYAIDMGQITRGIESLEQGNALVVDEMDNHPLWIQELNRYRKSDKFETLPPEIQYLFKQATESHLRAEMKIQGVAPVPPDQNPMTVSNMTEQPQPNEDAAETEPGGTLPEGVTV